MLEDPLSGQNPVNADCSKFAPTNAPSSSQIGLMLQPSPIEINTRLPATARIQRSRLMVFPPSVGLIAFAVPRA